MPPGKCGQRRLSKPPPAASLSREEVLMPEDPVEGFFTRAQWSEIGSALELSERELAVTILLIQGVSRRAIGLSLHKADGSCVSADTVRVYIDRVFRKARVTDRQELTLRLARVFLLLHGVNRQGKAGAEQTPVAR
jgi:DNA-binding NarL/FixJ family response regulator